MNVQQINYVIAVSELRSFGLAAERCFITQSTLSTMVSKFEKEIGIQLFDRKKQPVAITQEGKEIVRQLKKIQKEMEELDELAALLKGEELGHLRIGVIPTVAPYLLPIFLKKFAEQFPKMKFTVSELNTNKIVKELEERSLDIGIVSTPIKHNDFKEYHLYDEAFVRYDRRSEEATTSSCCVEHMDRSDLYLLEEGHCMRTQIDQICKLNQNDTVDSHNVEYKSGSIYTLLKMVKNNNGQTLIPYLASLELDKNDKKYISRFKDPVPVRSIGVLVHHHYVKEKLILKMVDFIKAQITPYLKGQEVQIKKVLKPV